MLGPGSVDIEGARVEDLRAAAAEVAAAKAHVDQLDVALSELAIRAPNAARVESLDLRPGDILAPNAPAATLLEDGQLYVRIYVPETEIGHVHVDQKVPVSVEDCPLASRATENKILASVVPRSGESMACACSISVTTTPF